MPRRTDGTGNARSSQSRPRDRQSIRHGNKRLFRLLAKLDMTGCDPQQPPMSSAPLGR